MNHFSTGVLCLVTLWIAGCSSTQSLAPVRESSYSHKRLQSAPAGFYRILSGDTLFKIAFQHGLDYRDLAAWNELQDPGVIRRGELLRLNPPKQVTTESISRKPVVVSRDIKPAATLEVELRDDVVPDAWDWPGKGPLLSRFGDGLNKGIDIGGARGRPVQAAASGRVVYAGSGLRGYGKLIIIRHGKTLLSAYAHNARILVVEGQHVIRGQSVAEMGDTDADRVKLHFEIREFGKPVDPLNFLPKLS